MAHIVREPVALAELVRSRRKDLGLSQAQLAALSQVSPRFVFDLESAKPSIQLDKLLAVLNTLGLTLTIEVGG